MTQAKRRSLQATYERHMKRRSSRAAAPPGVSAQRGYDPLDNAFHEARLESTRSLRSKDDRGETAAQRKARAQSRLRELLHEHLVVARRGRDDVLLRFLPIVCVFRS